MEIIEKKHPQAIIFSLKGRLDSTTSTEVEKKIIESINKGAIDVILDFSLLEYISSAGIRVLVHCHKEIEKKHGRIILTSLPKPIENVLYITGFLPYFKVYEKESQALEASQERLKKNQG